MLNLDCADVYIAASLVGNHKAESFALVPKSDCAADFYLSIAA